MSRTELNLAGFRDIEISDLDLIRKYLKKYQFRTCDYNAANLFAWSRFMNVKWGMYNDRILFYNFNWQMMLYPLGDEFTSGEILALSDQIMKEGCKGDFISVPESYVRGSKDISGEFEVIQDPPNSDYIYLTERLAELKGKKLHKKKNLVSQFIRNYPDYRVEKCSEANKDICIELAEKWCETQTKAEEEDKELEMKVMRRALDHFSDIGLDGLMIFVGKELAAFTYFSQQNDDSVTVHFEKFDYDYKGAAQMINYQTALYLKDRFKYINREQDVGKEGLRQAKMSYDPFEIIPTYRLIRK
ncbi:MAG TPA: phosphatidylglycerol lysyltransferase domain-containing protein [Clostridiales bacterium]|nr:phosphatidylglycerol lysyltransferase domain-containing protein [Clostridiales bacterium]